ncbi:DUF421 domain-containing protein [Bacillaceae bacterium SIJ1]|nr:DUF421 domain-containing protein [Litoribacterium kuwaitense]NGP43437.1 DUF421 domain-containing protein [Litoribacterium kuwaitense]
MDLLIIALRTILFYAIIAFIFRWMGKREIGELSILDIVVYVMIAELAVTAIEEPSGSIINTLLPMTLLVIVQIGMAFFQLKNQKLRDVVDGKPSILIRNGQINEREMRKQRYNLNDLLMQLREEQISDVSEVDFAVLEPSGELSVFEKKDNQSQSNDFTLPFILDGRIQSDHLHIFGKNEAWLTKILKKNKLDDPENILYLSIDSNDKVFVQKKEAT